MQAAKLAQKGIKPFGKKQTYKQKVTKVGEDEFQKAMKQEFDKELYLIDSGKAPGMSEASLFDLYEDIVSGARYSMLPKATRSKMITKVEDSMKAMGVDGGDFQNFRKYLKDEYGFANQTFLDDIRKGIDKGQIKTMKAEDFKLALKEIEDLNKDSASNIIPFKPRTKKSMGGQIGVGSLFRSR